MLEILLGTANIAQRRVERVVAHELSQATARAGPFLLARKRSRSSRSPATRARIGEGTAPSRTRWPLSQAFPTSVGKAAGLRGAGGYRSPDSAVRPGRGHSPEPRPAALVIFSSGASRSWSPRAPTRRPPGSAPRRGRTVGAWPPCSLEHGASGQAQDCRLSGGWGNSSGLASSASSGGP